MDQAGGFDFEVLLLKKVSRKKAKAKAKTKILGTFFKKSFGRNEVTLCYH